MAPHRLYGHRRCGRELFGRALGCEDAAAALEPSAAADAAPADPHRRHRALFQGADAGLVRHAADPGRDVREAVRARREREALRRCMPGWRRAIPSQPRRSSRRDRAAVARALEVMERHRPFARRLAERRPAAAACRRMRVAAVFLAPERAQLSGRIDARFHAMMAAGALDEVAALAGARARSAAAGDEGAWRAMG